MKNTIRRELLGGLAVFGSACCFYLATVVIRLAKKEVVIDPGFYVFARMFLGFIFISLVFGIKRQLPRPHDPHFLAGRVVFNLLSSYLFFAAVDLTTAAEANILNMTYPLFTAVFVFLFFKEQRDYGAYLATLVASIGIFFIFNPSFSEFRTESLWGLSSGMAGAVALIFLNLARQKNNSDTVLFYLFGLGTVLAGIFFRETIFVPDYREAYFLLFCSACTILGQYLITLGYRYVTPVEGGIIGSSRILLAAILGPFLTGDPQLILFGWLGAALIFLANVYFAIRRLA